MGNIHSRQLKRTISKSSRQNISYDQLHRIPAKEQSIVSKSRAFSISEEETEEEEEEEEEKQDNDDQKHIAKNVLTAEQQQLQQQQLIQQQYPNAIRTKISSLPPSPTCSHPPTETITINGRKYQNFSTKYALPADDQEQDRLVQCHFLYKYLYGGNFCAPVRDLLSGSYREDNKAYLKSSNRDSGESSNWVCVENVPPPRVLDIACGNGTWMLEMATEFPHAQFYGIDFLVTYPTAIKPSNTFFSRHDVLDPKGLPFPDNYFDYVFMRQVYICFNEADWIIIVKEIKRVVKPGGYVEFRDIDPLLKNTGPYADKLYENYSSNMKKVHNVDIHWAKHMFDYLRDVGDMTDMHRQTISLRMGLPGAIGNMIDNSLLSGLESYRLLIQTSHNYTFDEYSQLLNNVMDESINMHSYFNYYSCWGRKPLLDYAHSNPASSTMIRKQSGSTTTSGGGRYSFSTTTLNNHDENLHFPPSPSNTILHRRSLPLDLEADLEEEQAVMDDEPPKNYSGLTWDQGEFFQWNDESEIADLGSDSKDDIDQFVEGFED